KARPVQREKRRHQSWVQEIAGEDSALTKKHGLCFTLSHFSVRPPTVRPLLGHSRFLPGPIPAWPSAPSIADPQGSDLDSPEAGHWMLRRDLNGLIEGFAVEEIETRNPFFCL